MSYLPDDVWHFVGKAPYLSLSRPKKAVGFLTRQLQHLSECYIGLDRYPEQQVESLEFFYTTMRSLGMLDQESFKILMTELNWRGVVWGGWLALMQPDEEFADILRATSVSFPDNLWAVRCALARIESKPPPAELAELDELASQFREALRQGRIERRPLRRLPRQAEIEQVETEIERVRQAYKAQGVDAARQTMRGTLIRELSMPYEQWLVERQADSPKSEQLFSRPRPRARGAGALEALLDERRSGR